MRSTPLKCPKDGKFYLGKLLNRVLLGATRGADPRSRRQVGAKRADVILVLVPGIPRPLCLSLMYRQTWKLFYSGSEMNK